MHWNILSVARKKKTKTKNLELYIHENSPQMWKRNKDISGKQSLREEIHNYQNFPARMFKEVLQVEKQQYTNSSETQIYTKKGTAMVKE